MLATTLHYKYVKFFYTILAITVAVCVMGVFFSVQAVSMWLSASHQIQSQVASLCGCTQISIAIIHPWLTKMILSIALLFSLAIAVASAKLILLIVNTVRFQRTLHAHAIHSTRCYGITIHRVELTEPLAACVGFLHPQIYISTGLEQKLTAWELWSVLRHELSHAQHHDPLHRAILQVLQTFFPFSNRVFEHHQALQELVADEYVGDDQRLGDALIKLLQPSSQTQFIAATFFSSTNARLDRLLGHTMILPQYRYLFIVALVVMLGLGYGAAKLNAAEAIAGSCPKQAEMCVHFMSEWLDQHSVMSHV